MSDNVEAIPTIEQRRTEKINEVKAALQKLAHPRFEKLTNRGKMEKMMQTEIELLQKSPTAKLENHLVTCNYAFYKSIIDEIETMGNASAVCMNFKRERVLISVDIITNEPHVWIKVVNRSAKTILIEYRDGKRSGDIIEQIKQHQYVSRRFNKPLIRVIFKNGILREMAEKLTRHGIHVVGELVEKEDPLLIGKWNEDMIEKLNEDDPSWKEEEEESPRSAPIPAYPAPTVPTLNLDISAVMLLVSNLCEPGGANFMFKEEMINKHAACERMKPAKAEVLKRMEGHKLIMSKMAFERVSEIVSTVGGAKEKERFAELVKTIEQIPDPVDEAVGDVAKLNSVKDITPYTKRVFSCALITKTRTITANASFLEHAKQKSIYFKTIVIKPRPLTEQKEAFAQPL
ncbi:hypothetical protein CAEBREN_13383 [Caenorhabditis brenneri]|uniref:Uncharacterized protein n=1 Tax=Caenorhabditis brenneri TaxID=135651 RepID=G0PCB7_CAEBE|nr:hypothetical protein CAEBREN_13383 [Caenorhabditis brenneri]